MTALEKKIAEVNAAIASFFTKPKKAENIVALKVVKDIHYGWCVTDAAVGYSYIRMPIGFVTEFDTKAEAIEQMRRLEIWQQKGERLAFHTYETPERFEAVADVVYGVAW